MVIEIKFRASGSTSSISPEKQLVRYVRVTVENALLEKLSDMTCQSTTFYFLA